MRVEQDRGADGAAKSGRGRERAIGIRQDQTNTGNVTDERPHGERAPDPEVADLEQGGKKRPTLHDESPGGF